MDSLTQLTLGAAAGEAVLGRKVGRKAALWGAILGTLPDLDVLIPLGDPIKDFTYHRGASHALFFLTLAVPLMVWLILRVHPTTREHKNGWIWLVFVVFYTHVLLDCFTTYGTQILLPFSNFPVGWSTLFIIDPAYTLPLLAGILCAVFLKRSSGLGHRLNTIGLVISCIYLGWSVGAKLHVQQVVEHSLAKQKIAYTRLTTMATPLNTLLWRAVAMTDKGYVEGYYSVLDSKEQINFTHYESRPDLVSPIAGQWAVQRLKWFSKGFFKVSRENNKIIMEDLRMGFEPVYVFRFAVGKIGNPSVTPIKPEQLPPLQMDRAKSLSLIWKRIMNRNSL